MVFAGPYPDRTSDRLVRELRLPGSALVSAGVGIGKILSSAAFRIRVFGYLLREVPELEYANRECDGWLLLVSGLPDFGLVGWAINLRV